MQDHFLFNDSDQKQRGNGCDALCADDPRLKFKWMWTEGRQGKRTPRQVSEAVLENGWSLKAIFWQFGYEARVERYGDSIESFMDRWGTGPRLVTRLDAQLKAEELFEQIGHDILAQCEGVQ